MKSTVHDWCARLMLLVALAFMGTASAQLAPQGAAGCTDCGVVKSVRLVEKKGGSSGVGAVAGGVLGGIVGHQFGSGRGNTAMTIAGAAGGAYAGNEVEKNKNKKKSWNVTVKMDNGTTRTYAYNDKPEFREGDRVKTLDDGRRLALVAH
jgi:outer membrane lipoprotein SlyB